MRDILLVSGTRPEIIKIAPLYHALRSQQWARVYWLHTGQHGEMAQQILACFDITPDITLERRGSSLADFSIGCREQLEAVMLSRAWSLVVVQGDTESAFLGALAGFYHRVPVAHVEAGLRTYNPDRPFPEEGLRQMIGRVARFHFAPTERARDALLKENIANSHITLSGNTVVDAQQWVIAHRGISRQASDRGHMLVTVHRRENWGHDVEEICHAIADIATAHPDLPVLFPVHLNPVVQKPVHDILGHIANVQLVPPLDYLQMQQALVDAWLVLTDSGGLQEEAPTFGVPLLVLREETERPEAIDAGCARLVGTKRATIVEQVEALWQNKAAYQAMQQAGNPFGDGKSCEYIVATLKKGLAHKADPAPDFA
ncbi:non-hydrolyzing UDP-N-acetylglucosamine 2-epimerase [Silvimonas soli]|uniref:non-hydrolyzing UDP-N-acetylglucosamine 2-epimerase n=1 Tax=Silvimonas soli TaxID=2980100 RepID=UPI0024B3BA4B|nr:UDP-N-acetylglucosamine 2-epimerase (non-hydrolyzing) [Silvimonas soli]